MHKTRLTSRQTANLIPDGAVVAITGSGGGLIEADCIFAAIEERFLETGHPRELTLIHALGLGDRDRRGTNRFAHEGLVKRVIGGHWTWSRSMQELAKKNLIEAYSLPGGVISLLFRESGAGRPGLITKTGIGTFVDPRHQGGRINEAASDSLVELITLDGEDYLRFRPLKVDIGIICGSYADSLNNISTHEEPADLDIFAVALAAHNNNGRVFAQVRDQVDTGSLLAREVTVPGVLVDHVVVHSDQAQTYRGYYEPALAGLRRTLTPSSRDEADTGLRRVIALRAAEELENGQTVNLGFGVSAAVADIIAERGHADRYWTTIEQGIHGGTMVTGMLFGMAINPYAIISGLEQFDFYHGGGLDIAFLGMAEFDANGSVNVSHIGGQIVGPGGFIDISQYARKVVFCGTFDTKGSDIAVRPGGLCVRRNGQVQKLVTEVAAITFSGSEARARGQDVIYVTERAVFRLVPEGIQLCEYADGVDLQADIIDQMGFEPIVDNPTKINPEYFKA